MSNLDIMTDVRYKPARSFIQDRLDWCDDDRNPIVRAVRPKSPTSHNYTSIIETCREIIRDCDNQTRMLLWNEVEYKNTSYEFAPMFSTNATFFDDDDDQTSETPHDNNSKQLTTIETNSECFEALVKNKTAYT